MIHTYRYSLHLNWFGLIKLKTQQILDDNVADIHQLFPLSDGIWCFSSSDINLVVFPKYSPISLSHQVKGFVFPISFFFSREKILFNLLRQQRHIILGSILTFIPFEKKLVAVYILMSLRNLHFGQSQQPVLHFLSFFQVILHDLFVFDIP